MLCITEPSQDFGDDNDMCHINRANIFWEFPSRSRSFSVFIKNEEVNSFTNETCMDDLFTTQSITCVSKTELHGDCLLISVLVGIYS